MVLGSGGFARECYSWLPHNKFNVRAFYSETPNVHKIYDVPVVNNLSTYIGCYFLPAIGDPKIRARLWDVGIDNGLEPCTAIIHHSAVIGSESWIGLGSIVCPNSVVTCNVSSGDGLILNLGATIGHDCRIGHFVTINPGANISGNVEIGNECYIGTNAAVRERTKLGESSIIGMGAVVVKDVNMNSVVMGNPARGK